MNRLMCHTYIAIAAAFVLSSAGCAVMYKSGFETRYEQKNVYVSQVERLADNRLQIRYQLLTETVWYSPGVNYAVRDDALYITPVRCYFRHHCSPQALSTSLNKNEVLVTVPYRTEVVYMVYEDGETRLMPR